jgi:His-Xaa-Ser system radical SAM maturase HxsB
MKFNTVDYYYSSNGYDLLPFRIGKLPGYDDKRLITSIVGQWMLIDFNDLNHLVNHSLEPSNSLYGDLESKGFIKPISSSGSLAPLIAQLRTRKSFLFEGPSLHIFVVSLRCHHSCGYCQVSRQTEDELLYDINKTSAAHAVERVFESEANNITIEFQGGEPLLAFSHIKQITELVLQKNVNHNKNITFVIATTLHDLDDHKVEYFKEHNFKLSTSLDGPEFLHNKNRPTKSKNSYQKTLAGISKARSALGNDSVSALTTITKQSLDYPEEIVDEYVNQGFHSIFLRPLSPYGFAKKNENRFAYSVADFHKFYERAFNRILEHNRNGYILDEAYATMFLGKLLTPYANGYVDLRSPSGAGFGAIIYDYNGKVYPSDESRMLAAMGDERFFLGTVDQPLSELLSSAGMTRVIKGSVAESIPLCSDCVYLPYCGSDPIDSYARQGDEIGFRPSSDFCLRHMGFFDFIVQTWLSANVQDKKILLNWVYSNQRIDSPDITLSAEIV